MVVTRREWPTRGGGESSTRATRNEREGRVICSIFHGFVEETAHVQVSCSCDGHRRCALGFAEDAVPEPGRMEHAQPHTRSRARILPYMRCTKRWIYDPFSNRSGV